MGENTRYTVIVTLGENSTVFQAEVFAITEASRKLTALQTKYKKIEYFIDNQGDIKQWETTSQIVKFC